MTILLTHLWPSLVPALLLGLLLGWKPRAPQPATDRFGRLAAGVATLAIAAGAALCALALVPGRAGFWLESAVLHAAAYAAGIGVAWLARQARGKGAPEIG
jgi:hypothetical protein